jgi:RNA-binding protein YhbY
MEMHQLQLGKRGLTENFIKEATVLLNKHKQLKIKLLKSYLGDKPKEDVAKELESIPGNKKRTGNMVFLWKR